MEFKCLISMLNLVAFILVNLYNINCILILSFLFLHKSSSFVKLLKQELSLNSFCRILAKFDCISNFKYAILSISHVFQHYSHSLSLKSPVIFVLNLILRFVFLLNGTTIKNTKYTSIQQRFLSQIIKNASCLHPTALNCSVG